MAELFNQYFFFILLPIVGWGIWHLLGKRGNRSPLKKTTLWIGMTAWFITELARSFYRPYIYHHHIFDYHIADTIGNSAGTITAIFIIITLSGKGTIHDWKLILILICGLVGYEFLNRPSRIDPLDIAATIIFGGLSLMVYLFCVKKFSNKQLPVTR